MLENLQLDQDFDEDEFALVVEMVAEGRPVSVSRAKRLLVQTNCFVLDGDRWKYYKELEMDGRQITKEILFGFFSKKSDSQVHDMQKDENKAAITQGIRWCHTCGAVGERCHCKRSQGMQVVNPRVVAV